MQYFGGKARIAKELSAFLQSKIQPNQTFVDLFCGSCNVVSKIKADKRIANDLHKELIALHQAVQDGWIPPINVSEEEYRQAKAGNAPDHLKAFIGFGCSFAGRYFEGYARGNTKVVVSDNLSSKKSKSCGCLKTEFLSRSGNQYGLYSDREVATLKVQYSHLRRRNRKKGFNEIITLDEFISLSKSPCHYCGVKHSREIEDRLCESKSKKKFSDHILLINGIDCIDSSKGYTPSNSVPCCSKCNFAKHTMQEQEFFDWVEMVYNHIFNTTGVACVNTNRKFIGVEQDEGYFKIAQDRIQKAQEAVSQTEPQQS